MAIKSGKNALFTEINITPLTDINYYDGCCSNFPVS